METDTFISDLSHKEFSGNQKIYGNTLRQPILLLIQQEHPEFTSSGKLSSSELNYYREKYISAFLLKDIGEMSKLRENVFEAMKENTLISNQPEVEHETSYSFGQRIADKVASFGGSWTFILSFLGFITIWISINSFILLVHRPFDPFPFILLNLILSCIAALQAPVIMMSQNRQEEKDRERSKKDYMINLKSELEIQMLHEKLDHLIMHQQQELIEFQKTQIDLMNSILGEIKQKNP